MSVKEILISHDSISDSQTITPVMKQKFKEHGLDIHKNEVTHLEDDNKKGVRRLSVKKVQHFIAGGLPWVEKATPGRFVYDYKTRTFSKVK